MLMVSCYSCQNIISPAAARLRSQSFTVDMHCMTGCRHVNNMSIDTIQHLARSHTVLVVSDVALQQWTIMTTNAPLS